MLYSAAAAAAESVGAGMALQAYLKLRVIIKILGSHALTSNVFTLSILSKLYSFY